MQHVKAFVAGFMATLVFHQGLWAGLYAAGSVPKAAWDMTAVPPLGVPSVISLAFFGGLWGVVLWQLMKNSTALQYWLRAIVMGAIGPSALALLVVFPLKGLPILGGPDPKVIVGALLLNAAWGLGVGLMMKLLNRALPG